MIHLKRFNEELSPTTYRTAARKLKAKGHVKRSMELLNNLEIINWKKMINEFKKWGECEMYFNDEREIERGPGKFYIGLHFMDDPTAESIADAKESGDDIRIYFILMVIPADDETKKLCDDYLPMKDFDGGYYQGIYPTLQYKSENGTLKLEMLDISPGDNNFIFTRKAAVIFKKQLLSCFEEGADYDSGYTNITNMYEKIRTTLQDEDFTLEFDYDMDDIYNDIKKIPINDLYKN
jgi:hypothetical protein